MVVGGGLGGGSSPRAWGQQGHLPLCQAGSRFIPTRVGTTPHMPSKLLLFSVHPHARGDNIRLGSKQQGGVGSSPRAWGQRDDHVHWSLTVRFIPTRVGTTSFYRRSSVRYTVHPHARGDNFANIAFPSLVYGSSPRAWGQLKELISLKLRFRFIPTRVGTTIAHKQISDPATVHPHARGDNWRCGAWGDMTDGSSPRAWGQPEFRVTNEGKVRFIPTRVGTTPCVAPYRR